MGRTIIWAIDNGWTIPTTKWPPGYDARQRVGPGKRWSDDIKACKCTAWLRKACDIKR